MSVREFAMGLLISSGCNLDCYKGEFAKYALEDIQAIAQEQELPYPAEAIAEVLIQIGREQPDLPSKGHKPFLAIFDAGHTVDGEECYSIEEAKEHAFGCLSEWIVIEQFPWQFGPDGTPHLTTQQIESWDDMIAECSVYVVKWDHHANRYCDDDVWAPSYGEEYDLDWLSWEELKKKHDW